jgi:hypothetical protein
MRADLLVIAYYTAKTDYAFEARRLIDSIELLGLSYDVREIYSLGSWQANTHFKAEFLQSMAREYRDRRLLYLDADAVIRKEPILLDEIVTDIAVHYRKHLSAPDDKRYELLSGTIYLCPNSRSLGLLDRWIAENREHPDPWDQVNLAEAIRNTPELHVFELPPEYTFIFDTMRQEYPDADPVIEHFQASRRLKYLV